MKRLTEITNNIESLKSNLEILILKRNVMMNEYLNESLIKQLEDDQNIPPLE